MNADNIKFIRNIAKGVIDFVKILNDDFEAVKD
jgi:hypothetical protein